MIVRGGTVVLPGVVPVAADVAIEDGAIAAIGPELEPSGEKMRGVLDSVEFRAPQVPVVSAMNGAVHTSAEGVKEALKEQMVAPVRWVRVVDTFTARRPPCRRQVFGEPT